MYLEYKRTNEDIQCAPWENPEPFYLPVVSLGFTTITEETEGFFLTRLTSLKPFSSSSLCLWLQLLLLPFWTLCWSTEEGWTLIYFGQKTTRGRPRFRISVAGLFFFFSGLEPQIVDLMGEKKEAEGRSKVQKWEQERGCTKQGAGKDKAGESCFWMAKPANSAWMG